jgi:hypothetical protein
MMPAAVVGPIARIPPRNDSKSLSAFAGGLAHLLDRRQRAMRIVPPRWLRATFGPACMRR